MKKFLTLFVFGVLTSFVANAQYTETKDITPLGFSGNFKFLQFSQTRGLLAISDKNVLYISTDTAKTWETEKLPTDTVNQFIMYKDGLTGFITNSKGAYRTLNGGITWEKLPLTGIPSKIDGYEVNLVNLYFKTKDVVFYILTNKVNGKRIYKSSDCGNTWKEVAKDIYPNYGLPVGILVFNMHWNGETGYLYGNAFYAKTEDGGETWEKYCYDESLYEVCQEVIYSYDNGVAVIAENQYTTNKVFCSKDGNPTEKYNVQSTDEFLKLAQEVDGHLYAVDDNGKLWHSVDSAKTWEYGEIEKDKWIFIEGLYFFNEFIGVAVSRNLTSYVTLDGGETWTKYAHGGGDGFNNIYCKNENECFITGKTGRVFSTKDGGETWKIQNVHDGALYEIEFPTTNIGYIVGPQVLVKSTDGGDSWDKVTTEIMDSRYIDFVTNDVGYIGYANMTPLMYKTVDGGNSWNFLVDKTYLTYKKSGSYPFSFRNENEGAVCGKNVVLYTFDGGTSWRVIFEMPEHTQLRNILSLGDNGWLLYSGNTTANYNYDKFFLCDCEFNCQEVFSGTNSSYSGELQKINDTTYRFTYDTLDYVSTDEGLTWNPIYTGMKGQRFFVNKNLGYSITNNQIYKYYVVPTEIQMVIVKNDTYNYSVTPMYDGNPTTIVLYLIDENNVKHKITDEIKISNGMPVTIEIPASLPLGSYTLYMEAQDKNYLSTNVGIIVLEKSNAITGGQVQSPIYRVNGKTLYIYDSNAKLYTVLGTEIPIQNGVAELKAGVYILQTTQGREKVVVR